MKLTKTLAAGALILAAAAAGPFSALAAELEQGKVLSLPAVHSQAIGPGLKIFLLEMIMPLTNGLKKRRRFSACADDCQLPLSGFCVRGAKGTLIFYFSP